MQGTHRKKFLRKILIASVALGILNFSPVILDFNVKNLQIISVAYAEVKTYEATGRAEFNFGENNLQLIEMAKNYARMNAVQTAKEKAGIYLKSVSKTVNGVLTDDDISVVASNSTEIIDVKFKQMPYVSHDVHGNTTGEIGIAYEAIVTVKIDSNGLSKYVQRNPEEKFVSIEQNKSFQKKIVDINRQIEDLKRNPQKATSYEIGKINNEILAQQKAREGWKLYEQGNLQGAILKFNEAIKLSPNDSWMYLARGFFYYDLKNRDKAIADYNKAIELDSSNAETYLARGMAYGYSVKAIADYEKSIQLKPTSTAYRNCGFIYYFLKKEYDKALDYYTKAIQISLNKKDFETAGITYFTRGALYVEKFKNYNQAIEDFTKSMELNASNTIACYRSLGYAYAGLKEYEKSIENYSKAIQMESDKEGLYDLYERGKSYLFFKDYNKAIKDFTEVIKRKPNFTDAYYWRGKCYQTLGENSKAQADFAKAHELGWKG